MAALKDGEPDATVEVVAGGSQRVGLRKVRHRGIRLDERAYLPEVLGEENSKVLIGTGGRGW